MRISDWSSDVCSSDLRYAGCGAGCGGGQRPLTAPAAIVGGRRRDATALPSRPRRRRMAVRYVLGFPERSRRSGDRLWSCGFGLERRGRLGGGSASYIRVKHEKAMHTKTRPKKEQPGAKEAPPPPKT